MLADKKPRKVSGLKRGEVGGLVRAAKDKKLRHRVVGKYEDGIVVLAPPLEEKEEEAPAEAEAEAEAPAEAEAEAEVEAPAEAEEEKS